MSIKAGTTFSVQYTNGTGTQVKERPRLVITVDGKHKSLWVGEQTILATVPIDESDETLWNNAKKFWLQQAQAAH